MWLAAPKVPMYGRRAQQTQTVELRVHAVALLGAIEFDPGNSVDNGERDGIFSASSGASVVHLKVPLGFKWGSRGLRIDIADKPDRGCDSLYSRRPRRR